MTQEKTGKKAAPPLMGAILAGGRGSRMGPFAARYPKPILPICNRPLISYQIELMRSLGVEELVVLLGHRGFEIAKVLGDGRALGVKIHYVEQTELLGIAHAVGLLEPFIDRPFLLFLGDIFFTPKDLGEMVEVFQKQGGGAVLATKDEEDPALIRKNFSVNLSEAGYVTRVIEKPRYTTNRLKGVGLYLFDLTIFDAIRRTPRTAMRDEYEITDSIQVMIDDGYPVRVANVIEQDSNLTAPADLLAVNLRRAREMPPEALIGTGCNVHAGANIVESIIGANVTVSNPISITRSVVFEGTQLDGNEPIEDAIVTPDGMVTCPRPSS